MWFYPREPGSCYVVDLILGNVVIIDYVTFPFFFCVFGIGCISVLDLCNIAYTTIGLLDR